MQPPQPAEETADVVEEAQADTTAAAMPAIVAIRDVIEAVAPPAEEPACFVHPDAVDLIVRFEISSESYYNARLQGVIWPGLHSGATWGVGYDGGYQTKGRISSDWREHPQVDRLTIASGVVGAPAKALLPQFDGVRTPFGMARHVFSVATLQDYCELAKRTFRNGWDLLTPRAQGSLVATLYNRGASLRGSSRTELAVIHDKCVPIGDTHCMAVQYRLMPRVWEGTPVYEGLRRRYLATADLAEKT